MQTRKEYQAEYMRKYRARNPSYKQRERERDNERKKKLRRTDEDWLARERARRREYGKVSRYRNEDKDKVGREKYLLKNKAKAQARNAIMHAVKDGMKRPDACEKCHKIPEPFRDKRAKSGSRYPLRADHHKGYDKKNWLVVQWICIDCDGEQLRSKQKLVHD